MDNLLVVYTPVDGSEIWRLHTWDVQNPMLNSGMYYQTELVFSLVRRISEPSTIPPIDSQVFY